MYIMEKNMNRIIKSVWAAMLSLTILTLCGCPLLESLMEPPETLSHDGKTYKTGFYGDLYFNEENISSGTPTFDYKNFSFYDLDFPGHDWIACRSVISKIYTTEPTFESERAFYDSNENFDFYCTISGRDNSEQTVKINNPDMEKFSQLWTFAASHDYDPSHAGADKGQQKHAMPDPASEHYEARFYKVSKDGFFTSYKGNLFVMQDGKLQLLYYYDYANGNSSQSGMYTVELPAALEPYFRGIYNQIVSPASAFQRDKIKK